MSRRHNAAVRGIGIVTLECDMCSKIEHHHVEIEHDDMCLEFAAVQASDTWEYADDSLVCSEKCQTEFWEY